MIMEEFSFPVPPTMSLTHLDLPQNVSRGAGDAGVKATETDHDYEQFLADVWVGVVLTLMVLCCVCCMCSCLLYHKFQQWKRSVMEARTSAATLESGQPEAELPSYTTASGLPSYEEALEQLQKVKKLNVNGVIESEEVWVPRTPPTPLPLTVVNLFQMYKSSGNSGSPTGYDNHASTAENEPKSS